MDIILTTYIMGATLMHLFLVYCYFKEKHFFEDYFNESGRWDFQSLLMGLVALMSWPLFLPIYCRLLYVYKRENLSL